MSVFGSLSLMLRQVAEGVQVHESKWTQSNAAVVAGPTGVLLIDPGITADELAGLANDLSEAGHAVEAGFSTHPHWDHLLWHTGFGTAPRYATASAAVFARERLSGDISAIAKAVGIPDSVPLDLMGKIVGLPDGAAQIPWGGADVRILEHRAHAPGHAALLIEERGVLVAGDMVSDVLIPMLNLNGVPDPIGDYLAALDLLETVVGDVELVIPGHGSVGGADQLRQRIDQDRAYVLALRDGHDPVDPRIGPSAKPGWEWVADVHAGQVARLAI
jgi:glyoxylase-like metal-dependent hydrolase (beta-lactamase superfamily II)